MPFLLDTSILLRLVNASDPQHAIVDGAVQELLRRGERLYYTQQNRREFWNVSTRPVASNGFGLSAAETLERLRRIEVVAVRLADRAESGPEWDRLVRQYGVIGVAVHDAQLVASMLADGIPQILTLNVADFRRYAGEITPVHPADVAP